MEIQFNIMKDHELIKVLTRLKKKQVENETIECKKAESNYDFNKLGKYFSALSNEANLKSKTEAWLIFGIDDGTKAITGTKYRKDPKKLHSLKEEIANHTTISDK